MNTNVRLIKTKLKENTCEPRPHFITMKPKLHESQTPPVYTINERTFRKQNSKKILKKIHRYT